MYQASIRNTKKHKEFNNLRKDNYDLKKEFEEYAYVKKLLGNCRVLLITNSGKDVIGIIRGSLRKFSKRVIIEVGDIVVVSIRDYQESKVDIVHKYNSDQVQSLFAENKISRIISEMYHDTSDPIQIDDESCQKKTVDSYIDFDDISDISTDSDDE